MAGTIGLFWTSPKMPLCPQEPHGRLVLVIEGFFGRALYFLCNCQEN